MNVSGQSNEIYVGEFGVKLDAKGRLTIPSKWRGQAVEKRFYLAFPNPIGCITVYPPKMIQKLEDKISQVSLGNQRGQKVLTRLFSKADTFDYDKQGRILLNDHLMQHASLRGDVLFVGNYITFSLWNPEDYRAYLGQSEEDSEDVHAILRGLGL